MAGVQLPVPAPAGYEAEPPSSKLWMGDLEPHMDEALITNMYAQFGYQVLSVKMIRNHQTGMMARYCFVEFSDALTAKSALYNLTSIVMPGSNARKKFKLNWASKRLEAGTTEYNVFVADLSDDVTSQHLLEHFLNRYRSVRFAKVVEDENGVSKGYGFVRFCDQFERDRSLTEMDNTLGLGSKPIKIREAQPPKPMTNPFAGMMMMSPNATPTYPTSNYSVPQLTATALGTPSIPLVSGGGLLGSPQTVGYAGSTPGYYPPVVAPSGVSNLPLVPPPPLPLHKSSEFEDPDLIPDVDKCNAQFLKMNMEFYAKLDSSRWLPNTNSFF